MVLAMYLILCLCAPSPLLGSASTPQPVEESRACPSDSATCMASDDGLDAVAEKSAAPEAADDESAFLQTQHAVKKSALSLEEGGEGKDGETGEAGEEGCEEEEGEEGAHGENCEDEGEVWVEEDGAILLDENASAALLDVKAGVHSNRTFTHMTAAEKEEILAATNTKRCMHGAPPVTWSDPVTEHLEQFISGQSMQTMKHDNCYQLQPPYGPAGENLFAGSQKYPPAQAVESWYSEVNDCQGGPTGFTDGCQNGVGGKPTGHFTALVWKGVKKIGCAYSNNNQVIGCRYWSGDSLSSATPNMGGSYVSQVGLRSKSASECGGSAAGGGNSPSPSPSPSPPPTPPPAPPAARRRRTGGCRRRRTGSSGGGCPYARRRRTGSSGSSGGCPYARRRRTGGGSGGGSSGSSSVTGPSANCVSANGCQFTNACGKAVLLRWQCKLYGMFNKLVQMNMGGSSANMAGICGNQCSNLQTMN